MESTIIFWLIALSMLFHAFWELTQAKWVVNLQGKPWYLVLRNCLVGISLDTLYTLGVYYLFAFYKSNKEWVMNAGVKDYTIIFVISVLAAYAYEWMGWKLKLWSFSEEVPHLPEPFAKVALPPLIQLPLLVCLSFLITQYILPWYTR